MPTLKAKARLYFLCGLFFVGLAAPAHALERVRLQLNWLHQFEFAGFYAALEKGYYREAGLDVTLAEGGPQIDPIAEVKAGRADVGVSSSHIVIERIKTPELRVLGVMFQHSPAVILSPRQRGIHKLSDLQGKRLMDSPNAGDILAMLKKAGVPPESLKRVPHTGNPASLVKGLADAMVAYSTNEPFVLEESGVPYVIFSPRSLGIDFYGDNLFTVQSQLSERRSAIRKFYQASLRGWQYALANQGEIVDLILDKYSQEKSRAALTFEAQQSQHLIQADLVDLGYQSQVRWSSIAATYEQLGFSGAEAAANGLLVDASWGEDNTRLWYAFFGLVIFSVVLSGLTLTFGRLNRELRRHRDHLQQMVEEQTRDLRRAKDTAEAANRAKDVFLTNISHELRTPMHGILSMAKIGFRKTAHEAPLKKWHDIFNHILKAGERMQLLVDDLLEVSSQQESEADYRLAPSDLRVLCDKAVARMSRHALNKAIAIEFSGIAEAPLRCDAARIGRVLGNLIDNAIKFSPPQQQIDVGLHALSNPARWQVTIADRGPGIPENELAVVFETFVQGSHTTNGAGGKGLGLALCRQIVEGHGGRIKAENRPEGGAVLSMEFPVTAG